MHILNYYVCYTERKPDSSPLYSYLVCACMMTLALRISNPSYFIGFYVCESLRYLFKLWGGYVKCRLTTMGKCRCCAGHRPG